MNLYVILILMGSFPILTEALSCYQCNVFIRNSQLMCSPGKPMKKIDDCVACMKTFTRLRLHNTFHDELDSSYESHLCVKDKSYSRPAGCYPLQADSGYMKRCFCYNDFCNGSHYSSVKVTLISICLTVSGVLKRLF